jgi:hypothetical protein
VIHVYRVNLVGTLFGCGIAAATGSGFVAYAMTREPHSKVFLGVGGVILVIAAAIFFLNVVNLGRRLELRKFGLRYLVYGSKTELLWHDIVDIDVRRKDMSSYGPVHVFKESTDEVSSSGLLTNTDFTVTIHGRDGESIKVGPTFLKIVPDPKRLIQKIRTRADLPS